VETIKESVSEDVSGEPEEVQDVVPTMSVQNFNSDFKDSEGPLLKSKINELQDFIEEVTNPEEVVNNVLTH
jgi:hypothetical protein